MDSKPEMERCTEAHSSKTRKEVQARWWVEPEREEKEFSSRTRKRTEGNTGKRKRIIIIPSVDVQKMCVSLSLSLPRSHALFFCFLRNCFFVCVPFRFKSFLLYSRTARKKQSIYKSKAGKSFSSICLAVLVSAFLCALFLINKIGLSFTFCAFFLHYISLLFFH